MDKSLDIPHSQDNAKDKPKKPRHRHSAFQLAALNELYDKNEHPPLDERTALADKLGMEVKTVNAWFQNKRASSKKRHKTTNPQFELPPISALIASVSSAPPPQQLEFDDMSDDEQLPPLSEQNLAKIPHSAEHSRRQSAFYTGGNPQHRHLSEADQASHRKGRSRPTPQQSEELRKLYDRNPHPSKEEREELGDRIGMRYQSVTNWFQNQRSIAKKRKDEEDAQSAVLKMDHDESSSSSRTYSPFPPSSGAIHPSLSVPPATRHPSLAGLAIPQRMRRASPMSSHIDSRASSPRPSPYRAAVAERASSVTSGRARRSRPEPYQLEALKKLFHRTATPSIEERGALAMEINMDVGKVTNWFRNLRQTTRKRTKRMDDGDDDDDDISLATYTASRDVSRAGSPLLSGSSASLHEDDDVVMSDPVDVRYRHSDPRIRQRYDGKPHRMYSHLAHSRSHSDVGSDDEYQEAVTPSPESSPAPPSILPVPTHVSKRPHAAQSPGDISLTVDALSYAEMEKATAKYHTGVKVEDALLLLSFHHNVVR
ncbi:homeobox-domain-containing protein [Cristinia sonorae]|uniref:Homeobox-domain-containing protein n=1 Tax=Cristinia sonorae TaxID=1940300 RepID=A0A8K0ULH4_9AGAR|nr:homeobox-domain-containing protein [Cristinia sonorae]